MLRGATIYTTTVTLAKKKPFSQKIFKKLRGGNRKKVEKS